MRHLHRVACLRRVRRTLPVLVASLAVVGVLMLTSSAASAAQQVATNSAGCLVSGTVRFSPPLGTRHGGAHASKISASLSDCTSNDLSVQFYPSSLTGVLASSPFTCSSSSSTSQALSGVIRWRGTTFPKGKIAPTRVSAGDATGSFAGTAVVSLEVPSVIAGGCTGAPVSKASVTGTLAVGEACGQVGEPVSVYSIAPPICGQWDYRPTAVTTGPDGALWFTLFSDNLIGRTTTAGVTSFYPLPYEWDGQEGNGGITSGPDGALWFLENSGRDIGRITTTGSVSTFPLPSGIGLATAITTGPDGALWFTTYNTEGDNTIGRLTTSGQFTIFTDPSLGTGISPADNHQNLWDITTGPDGALWFSSYNLEPAESWIGRITTTGVVTEYQIPFAGFAQPLVAGPDGAIWFGAGNVIGRVTTSGVFSEYTGQSGQIAGVAGLAAGPDGAVWYTNDIGSSSNQAEIGEIATDGTITTYSDPNVDGATGITAGPDGAMWVTDNLNDSIARVAVP